MIWVKKSYFPKSSNDDSLKLSTDIINIITRLMDKTKNKDKIINEYAKIIHNTKQ